jgi:hypothetical protein
MTQDEIDTMWQQAMRQSIEEGEMFTRYHFAKLVAAKAIAELESQEPDWKDGVMEQQEETILWQAKRIAELIDTPSQRTWVGLTNQEIDSYFEDHGYSTSEYYYPVIKDIEAKLKEKNT